MSRPPYAHRDFDDLRLDFPGLGGYFPALGAVKELLIAMVCSEIYTAQVFERNFRPRSSKVSVQKYVLCPFHCKPRPSAVSLESPGLENIPQLPGNRAEVGQNHDLRKVVSATLTLKKKWGYISAQKLEGESSQRFALSVSMQSKAITS